MKCPYCQCEIVDETFVCNACREQYRIGLQETPPRSPGQRIYVGMLIAAVGSFLYLFSLSDPLLQLTHWTRALAFLIWVASVGTLALMVVSKRKWSPPS
jgi:hypothetical protein